MREGRPLARLLDLAARRPVRFALFATLALVLLALLAVFRAEYDAHAPPFVYGRF